MSLQNEGVILKVLIVEDDVNVAEINRRFVEKVDGYQVVGIATDEEQAKTQLEVLQPDLVLLDLYFPNLNGFDLLRYINEFHSQTNVIMITAGKEVETVKNAIRFGVYDFIVKPVIFERFRETLVNYQEYRLKFEQFQKEHKLVNQEEIDLLIEGARNRGKRVAANPLPKGIDKLTLKKMRNIVQVTDMGLTAEQAGEMIGASRSTARRYLEFLVSQGEVLADLSYGVVGRPERVYRCVRHKK